VKAGLVSSTKDYYWSGFRSLYSQGDEPLAVDHDWWWPGGLRKAVEGYERDGMVHLMKKER
jgi:hypothetical protein